MKKLLTILLVLISFSSFAQFEAGEFVNTDTVKLDGVPLLLNTFKQGNLGGASNIFYSTGASSQPASGTVNQVVGGGLLTDKYLTRWDGTKFVNSGMVEVGGNAILGGTIPTDFGAGNTTLTTNSGQSFAANLVQANGVIGQIFSSSNDAVYLGSRSDHPLNLTINNYTKLRINLDGKIAINKTTADEFIDINGNLIADVLKSRVPTGTPPLVVASTTKVDSLNAGLLDGKHASDFQLKSDTSTFDATISDLNDSTAAVRALANTKAVVSGTDNYIMKKTGTNTIGNSTIVDNGSTISTALPFSSNTSLSAPTYFAGASYWNSNFFELGFGQIGNRYSAIDLTGDDTYSDYGLRIIRGNTGENTFSNLVHRGKGDFVISAQDAGRILFGTKNTNVLIIDTLQNVGIGAIDTTYELNVVGKINATGGFFKNGVEIGSGGINYIGMTMPTGLSVSPANLTANGTFTISYPSGYTYFTDSERSIYSNANQKRITSASFSGTTTKTLTLSQVDGGVLQAAFTDLQGTSQWTNDANGMYYNSGNVTVGTGASTTAAKFYVYNNVATYSIYGNHGGSGYGVLGVSQSGAGVYGNSTTGFGGQFDGLGCKSTKYYVSSLNTAPASSSATGTTGEIRICSTGIYICIATNTWIRQLFSTW